VGLQPDSHWIPPPPTAVWRIEVRHVHADGDYVFVEHSGPNEMSDGRRYDNNYCWALRFQNGLIQEVREYMDTQLVTETFGANADS
jgi:ketosteroid isomerase-like protein